MLRAGDLQRLQPIAGGKDHEALILEDEGYRLGYVRVIIYYLNAEYGQCPCREMSTDLVQVRQDLAVRSMREGRGA